MTILEDTFSIPIDFQLESFWEKWKINFKQILSQVPFYAVTLKLLSLSKGELRDMDIIEETTIDNESLVSVNLYTYNNACKRIIEYGNAIEVLSPEELRKFIIKNAQELLMIYLGNKTNF